MDITLGHVLALVVELLATAEANAELHAVVLVEIELKRDEGHALCAELAVKVVNLMTVQQEPALPVGVHVPHAAVGVGVDVHAMQPHLSPANEAEGVRDLGRALAQALDLGAGELDARLKGLVHKVLVSRRAVARDGLLLALSWLGHRPHPRWPADRFRPRHHWRRQLLPPGPSRRPCRG